MIVVQLLHLWIVSDAVYIRFPVRFSQRPDTVEKNTHKQWQCCAGVLPQSCTRLRAQRGVIAGSLMGPKPSELQQQTPLQRPVKGRKINELKDTTANNYSLMNVKTVSKPYATGTCSCRRFSCWWLKLMVGFANVSVE